MAKKKKNKKSFWRQLRFKYKLSFFNENTLEEVWSSRISLFSAILTIIVFAFSLIAITALFIVLTPIRNYLPGYLDVEIREEIVQNALRADSLERMIEIQSLYLDNVTDILSGTTSLDSIKEIETQAQANVNFEIPRGENEKKFISTLEEEEKYNLTSLNTNVSVAEGIFFTKPINGIISSKFEPELSHYGIDLVTSPNESVLATLDGTVIFVGYDPNFGNIIQIQHRNGYLSIYKHSELLLKKTGDQVIAGEAIAIVGNTGELSTGPHLHFELWYKGSPINPAEYIAF